MHPGTLRKRNRPGKEGTAQIRMGHGFRRAARDRADHPLRQARLRLRLPDRGQGLLHGTLARPPGGLQDPWICWPRKATARSSAARSACPATICCCSASTSTACPRKPSSGTWTCASIGSVPHSGFGMGVERTVSWICGIEHIREAIAFPRTIKRVYP